MGGLMKIVAVWVISAGMALGQSFAGEQGIIVTGEGQVSLPPDMVTISLGVSGAGKSTSEVLGQVTEGAAALQAKLAALGIPPEDRQTSGFYLHPVQGKRASSSTGVPEITGYRAGNTVTVRVRDLAMSGALMDDVIAVGVNHFNGLSFGLQESATAMAQARKRAVADAQMRARQLAEAAGVTLGGVVRITESSHHGGPILMEMSQSRASMGDAISAGEVEVRAQVTMVFAIAPL